MFGRVRQIPSSMDSLELPPSKFIKDDSLSIYESTLLKLKLGSRHDPSPQQADIKSDHIPSGVSESSRDVNTDTAPLASISTHDAMMIDKDCCNDCQSTKQLQGRNSSVIDMFSKYKSLREEQS